MVSVYNTVSVEYTSTVFVVYNFYVIVLVRNIVLWKKKTMSRIINTSDSSAMYML